MILVWSDLSCADREATAVLVAINSVFQVLMFGVLGWFYLQVLPSWLGLPTVAADFSFWDIVKSVLVFLGIPLAAGVLSRLAGERLKGREWYEEKFIPRISPFALIGLLYTIVLLFSLQGHQITSNPWAVVRLAAPLLIYFVGMFFIALAVSRAAGMNYAQSASVSFTAAGNNFELAIAVSIGTFGAFSGQALAGTIGPHRSPPCWSARVRHAVAGPRLFPPTPPSRLPATPATPVTPATGPRLVRPRLVRPIRPRLAPPPRERKPTGHEHPSFRPVPLRRQRRQVPDGGRPRPAAPRR